MPRSCSLLPCVEGHCKLNYLSGLSLFGNFLFVPAEAAFSDAILLMLKGLASPYWNVPKAEACSMSPTAFDAKARQPSLLHR